MSVGKLVLSKRPPIVYRKKYESSREAHATCDEINLSISALLASPFFIRLINYYIVSLSLSVASAGGIPVTLAIFFGKL